jgi:type IV secretion system protein VirD4
VAASRVVWGQIVVVFAIVLFAVWMATQWTAWRLGFQPQLGSPWFSLAGLPVYPPPAFFWWWFFYDAYAPRIFWRVPGLPPRVGWSRSPSLS